MKILSREQIREADAYTIAHEPISSVLLMERAARRAYDYLVHTLYTKEQLRSQNLRLHFVCGSGNNGGDGLYMARLAQVDNLSLAVSIVKSDKYSEDNLFQQSRLKEREIPFQILDDAAQLFIAPNDIIIDALFGTGLSSPLEGAWAAWTKKLNTYPNPIISIDIPSGLMPDSNMGNQAENIVNAKVTLTFQTLKRSFFIPPLCAKAGYYALLDIGLHPAYMAGVQVDHYFIDKHLVKKYYLRPDRFRNKIHAGRALLIAGSEGKEGAALLAAKACKKAGVGLLHVCGAESQKTPLLTLLPEAMFMSKSGLEQALSDNKLSAYNTIGVGPGMGTDEQSAELLSQVLAQYKKPMVLDADALTIVAANKMYKSIPENSILTPHMGELKRLLGDLASHEEAIEKARQKAQEWQVIFIIKGHFTAICTPDGVIHFNNTGNRGMATGGSGDVLTGIITALLAGGYTPKQAAILGVYIHGVAGDLALERQSFESLIASDIIHYLGRAFKKI